MLKIKFINVVLFIKEKRKRGINLKRISIFSSRTINQHSEYLAWLTRFTCNVDVKNVMLSNAWRNILSPIRRGWLFHFGYFASPFTNLVTALDGRSVGRRIHRAAPTLARRCRLAVCHVHSPCALAIFRIRQFRAGRFERRFDFSHSTRAFNN